MKPDHGLTADADPFDVVVQSPIAQAQLAAKDKRIAELEAAFLALYSASIETYINLKMLALDEAEHALREQLYPQVEE